MKLVMKMYTSVYECKIQSILHVCSSFTVVCMRNMTGNPFFDLYLRGCDSYVYCLLSYIAIFDSLKVKEALTRRERIELFSKMFRY
jgi:hypothetical protein